MCGTLIIDGNSIGHANHNATKLTVGDLETQAIFGVVKSIHALMQRHPGWNPLMLWDGRAQWRFDLYPEYKGNREATDAKQQAHKDSYKKQVPFIRKALQLMGVRQMLVESAEADDMGGLMTKKLADRGIPVKLVTGDKDWLQLVRRGVTWFDPIRDRACNLTNFFEFTGYKTPEAFLDGKALMGDGSDHIGGVGGIGEKGAPEFLAEFGSVAAFYEQVDSGLFVPKKKAHVRLCGSIPLAKWEEGYDGDPSDEKAKAKYMDKWPGEGRVIFQRNRKLMNLLDVPIPRSEDVVVIAPTPDRERFRTLCEKLAFHSILRDIDAFLEPFKQTVAKAA